jgi:hypothetical protein
VCLLHAGQPSGRRELQLQPDAGWAWLDRANDRAQSNERGALPVLIAIGVAVGIVAGVALALLAVQMFGATGVGKARRLGKQILDDAARDAEAVRREAELEARERAVKLRADIDAELTDRRESVLKIEERILAREEEVERRAVELSRRDRGSPIARRTCASSRTRSSRRSRTSSWSSSASPA